VRRRACDELSRALQHRSAPFRANVFRIVEVFFNILIYRKKLLDATRNIPCQHRPTLLICRCHEWPRANLDGGRKQGLEVPTPSMPARPAERPSPVRAVERRRLGSPVVPCCGRSHAVGRRVQPLTKVPYATVG
jgi:hypothetical protein